MAKLFAVANDAAMKVWPACGRVFYARLCEVSPRRLAPSLGLVDLLGALPSLFAYSAWYWAIRRVRSIGFTLYAQPFVGAWAGCCWTWGRTWAGGALILGALAWTQMISRKTAAPLG
jgi:hypothetical protein